VENYTNTEMTDMVLCYRSADGVALRAQTLYREKFPVHPVPHSQIFLAIVQRLRENCRYLWTRARSWCYVKLETVEENPSTSTPQLAVSQFQVSQFVVCRTLKKQGLYPQHVQRMQASQLHDYIRR
jgi:hypothetical protein